ncbi:MAG TPA: D-2-hydroxyacid dehydrogenase [Anaerolineales bacterium]|jgi:phosphoglycerate dehydrogenase-like enzyme
MPVEVLITTPFSETSIRSLAEISPKLNITLLPVQNANEVPAETWARTEVLYSGHILPEPEQTPALRWVQFHFAGIDRYLEEPIFKKPGLQVTTLSGAAAPQMAEHVLAMLLAMSRKLPALITSQKKAEWPKDRFERFEPFELNGKTIGIVGYGSIGRQIARLLHPFGVTILATKRNVMNPHDDGYSFEGQGDPHADLVHRLYPPQALRSMLKECHIVIVTVPLTRDTENLLNAKNISALKPGGFLVDVSRGGIVNLSDVADLLKSGHLGGAAVDVFPEEPLPASSPLWQTPSLIVSPHISGGSVLYKERALLMFAENLRRYLAGLPLFNIFDPGRGY